MYKPTMMLGAVALSAAALVPNNALTYDPRLKILDASVSSCNDAYEKNAGKSVTLDVVIGRYPYYLHPADQLSFGLKRPIPMGVVAYLKTDDEKKLARAQQLAGDADFIAGITKRQEEDWFENQVSLELEVPYTSMKGKQALDALIAAKGDLGARTQLNKKYREYFERMVDGLYRREKNPQKFEELLLKDYFKEIGPAEYTKQARKLSEKRLIAKAYRHAVNQEMRWHDVFKEYKDEQGKAAYESLTKGHDLKQIFMAANERAKTGNGTLESNLKANPVYQTLIAAVPADKLPEVFSYTMVGNFIKHEIEDNLFRFTHDTIPLVISSQIIEERIRPNLKRGSTVSLTLDATIGCATKEEIEGQIAAIKQTFKGGEDISSLDWGFLTSVSGIELTERSFKRQSSRAFFYIAQEVKDIR